MRTLFALLGALYSAAAAGGEDRTRPNVVLILADDLGTLDLRSYGSKDLQTPHLDRLAEEGVRFTQLYAASPVCSPSRAALLTGRYPQRAGVKSNVSSRPGRPGLPSREVTIAEVLRGGGYRTALFGKWHLGTVPECEPQAQGFDEFFGHKGGCIDNLSHYLYWEGPPLHDLHRGGEERFEEGRHFTEMVVREAARFLEESRDRPFFLYLPFNIPHYPLQAPAAHREKFRDLPEPRRSYAASVSALDTSVGEVLARLEALGVAGNTLVVFLSDHGHSTEERANHGGGNAGPHRGAKFSLFEGGIRVPCIACWPGRIPRGEVRGQPALSIDWLPTIAELCGITLPDRTIDGRSLAAVLRSSEAPSPHRVLHFQFEDQWAAREGDWKLVVNARDTRHGDKLEGADRTFLVNLAQDAGERRNLAGEHPDRVARLTALHEEWAAEVAK